MLKVLETAKIDGYEMRLEKSCSTEGNFEEIGFQIFLRIIQSRRCCIIVWPHVPKSESAD